MGIGFRELRLDFVGAAWFFLKNCVVYISLISDKDGQAIRGKRCGLSVLKRHLKVHGT